MTYERKPRVLLMELELRQSEKTGRAWGSGFLGKSRVIAFEADEPNQRGHRFLKVFVEEPDPRPGTQRPAQGQQESRGPPAQAAHSGQASRPEASQRPYRRETEASRRERVASEILEEHGDPALDDSLPF
jgi:hypothetical protein